MHCHAHREAWAGSDLPYRPCGHVAVVHSWMLPPCRIAIETFLNQGRAAGRLRTYHQCLCLRSRPEETAHQAIRQACPDPEPIRLLLLLRMGGVLRVLRSLFGGNAKTQRQGDANASINIAAMDPFLIAATQRIRPGPPWCLWLLGDAGSRVRKMVFTLQELISHAVMAFFLTVCGNWLRR